MHSGFAVPFVLASCLLPPTDGQDQAPIRLERPQAVAAEPFSDVTAVVALGGDRALVVDRREQRLSVVDFATGSVRQISRIGDGPGEHRVAWSAFAARGDSALVYDSANQRFLVVHPDGSVGRFIALVPDPASGDSRPLIPNGPRFLDSGGAYYWTGTPFLTGLSAPVNTLADSFPILRWSARQPVTDTLGWLRRPGLGMRGPCGSARADLGRLCAYLDADDWAVGPDGAVVILRSESGRVEMVQRTGARREVSLPASRVPLREWHKAQWRERQRSTIAYRRPIVGGALGAPQILPARAEAAEPDAWPATLASFRTPGMLVAVTGEVWVPMVAAGPTDPARYHVLDPAGRRRQLDLPPGRRVVLIQPGHLVAVHSDADGLLHLERYALPR